MRDIKFFFFFFQAEDGIRDYKVTGVQTCALPILRPDERPHEKPRGEDDGIGDVDLSAPIVLHRPQQADREQQRRQRRAARRVRSEEHTSELQSPCNLVCRLLLEKKKKENDSKIKS